MIWKIPVTCKMYACIQIKAESLEAAMEIAEDQEGKIPLSANGEYVDGSWALSCAEVEYIQLFNQNRGGSI